MPTGQTNPHPLTRQEVGRGRNIGEKAARDASPDERKELHRADVGGRRGDGPQSRLFRRHALSQSPDGTHILPKTSPGKRFVQPKRCRHHQEEKSRNRRCAWPRRNRIGCPRPPPRKRCTGCRGRTRRGREAHGEPCGKGSAEYAFRVGPHPAFGPAIHRPGDSSSTPLFLLPQFF